MYKLNKANVFQIIALILVICWMSFVFYFSNQPSDKSTTQSSSVIEKILNIFPEFQNMEYNDKLTLIGKLQPVTRKLAHFSLYTIGGILISLYVIANKNKIKHVKSMSILIGLTYSITDEIHQFFIPGRSCEIRDVLIDTSGIIVGTLIIFTIAKIVEKHKIR